ncbi:MAG: uncharacterized protein JWM68_3490 [Verrucomicrobiales bacterium]|nr:uncharacterized protein [Verrucomicrobiales bacterium]
MNTSFLLTISPELVRLVPVQINVKEHLGDRPALGGTAGEDVMLSLYQSVANSKLPYGSLIVLNFDGIEHVNGSFIKATALWVFISGQLSTHKHADEFSPKAESDPRPYDIFPCVIGLSPEVQKEFQEFLKPRRVPVLFGKKLTGNVLEESIVLGGLDPMLRNTLTTITQNPGATAPELHRTFSNQDVTVTAWNNRLNDLHALRLVQRVRVGRVWKYQSLTGKIIWE